MFYVLICTDKPDHLDVRMANREAHLAYITATGVVAQGGAFKDDSGAMCGSLIILDVPDRQAAQNWAEQDPYAQAGLFADVRIEAWNRIIGG